MSDMMLAIYIIMLAQQATLVNLCIHCTLTNLHFPPFDAVSRHFLSVFTHLCLNVNSLCRKYILALFFIMNKSCFLNDYSDHKIISLCLPINMNWFDHSKYFFHNGKFNFSTLVQCCVNIGTLVSLKHSHNFLATLQQHCDKVAWMLYFVWILTLGTNVHTTFT